MSDKTYGIEDRFWAEKYNIQSVDELQILKEHGAKFLEKKREIDTEYSAWRHEKNEKSFQNFKILLQVIIFPVGLYNLHRKKVKSLETIIIKKDKEIERLKTVHESIKKQRNRYKGGSIEWRGEFLEEEMTKIEEVKEA